MILFRSLDAASGAGPDEVERSMTVLLLGECGCSASACAALVPETPAPEDKDALAPSQLLGCACAASYPSAQ